MTDTDTPKALHDAVQNVIGRAQTCSEILAVARAIHGLGTPEDLAGTLRGMIHAKATGNEEMNGLLPPGDAAALVEAWDLVKPRPVPVDPNQPVPTVIEGRKPRPGELNITRPRRGPTPGS